MSANTNFAVTLFGNASAVWKLNEAIAAEGWRGLIFFII